MGNQITKTDEKYAREEQFSQTGRAISKSELSALNQYGCWCTFGEEHGKGSHVDEFDYQCKVLQKGYECINMDYSDEGENQGEECNIWTVEYIRSVGNGNLDEMSIARLINECESNNGGFDTCGTKMCKVEGYFIQRLLQLVYKEGKKPQFKKYSHKKDVFDQEVICAVKPSTASEKECCGDYPLRSPFKTYGGDKGCCDGRTYGTEWLRCCDDGVLRMFCGDE